MAYERRWYIAPLVPNIDPAGSPVLTSEYQGLPEGTRVAKWNLNADWALLRITGDTPAFAQVETNADGFRMPASATTTDGPG